MNIKMREEIFKNIVFLDIDGVLQNNFTENDSFTYEKDSIAFLNQLYEEFQIKLVLSSSWRHAFTFQYMQDLLKENGILAPLIDRTYIVTDNERVHTAITLDDLDKCYTFNSKDVMTRDCEVFEWIKMFHPEHYLVLDDFSFSIESLESHRIKRLCAFEKGGCVNLGDLPEAKRILHI